jgi:hypothetical protein
MKTARRIAAMNVLAMVAGLVTVALGVATGNWPVVMIVGAVAAGAGLLAALADLRETEARCEAARLRNQASAGIEPGRDVEPDIQERLAGLKAYYARVESVPENGGGRFRERVSADDPPGWDRQH